VDAVHLRLEGVAALEIPGKLGEELLAKVFLKVSISSRTLWTR